MGAPFFAKAPGRMAFVMRDNVKVGGCVWQYTAATGISKGMIRNVFLLVSGEASRVKCR
jgi:hypothetical protein